MKYVLLAGGVALALSAPAVAASKERPSEKSRGIFALSLDREPYGATQGKGRGEGHRKDRGRGHDKGRGFGHDKYDRPDSN